MKITYSICDQCRKRITPERSFPTEPTSDDEIEARFEYHLREHWLVGHATHEGARYEWQFCSGDCLIAWLQKSWAK